MRVASRRGRLSVIVLGGLVVALLLCSAPARAASVDRAFSDTNSAPSARTALLTLRAQLFVCRVKRPRRPPPVPSLPAALSLAQRVLAARSSGGRVAGVIADTSRRGRGYFVALGGLAKGQPGVALLGFLAARQRSPGDPLPLLDAAVMLSSLGYQPEALALLGAASRLPEPPGFTLGISVRALIDNAFGVVRFRMGQFSAAEALFRSALARAPGLSAARRNLAAALLCRGKFAAAVPAYIGSTYFDPVQSGASSGGQTLPVPSTALDLSKGIPGTLPKLTIPPTADDGAASHDDIAAADQRAFNAGDQAFKQGQSAIIRLSTQQTPLERTGVGRLVIRRQDAILGIWNNWRTERPDLAALYDKVQSDHDQMETMSPSAALDKQVQDIQTACGKKPTTAQQNQCLHDQCWPAVQAGHANWLPSMKSYDGDVRAFAREIYRYATAVASNTASPTLAAAITQSARQLMYVAYHGELANALDTMTNYESIKYSECHAASSGSAAGDDANTSSLPGFECPPGLSAVKFSLKFATILEVKVSCDAIEINASDSAPITPYAAVKYKFADGSISALVGAKAGYELDKDVKLSVKGGIYMDWDANGNPTDVGVKVSGPSLGGKWGDVGISTKDATEAKVSLAPIVLQ